MRTTVRIDEDLYRRAKADAARRGQTVGQVLEDALRLFFRRSTEDSTNAPDLPVFGGSGTLPGVDLGSSDALADLMDAGRPTDALR